MEKRRGSVWQEAITKIVCAHRGSALGDNFYFEIPDMVGLTDAERTKESTLEAKHEYCWRGNMRSRISAMVRADILIKTHDYDKDEWVINPTILDVLAILTEQPNAYFSLEEIVAALGSKGTVTRENLTQWRDYYYIDERTHKATGIRGYCITKLGLTLLQDSKKTAANKS